MVPLDKPAHLFDRHWEWRELAAFAAGAHAGPALGLVSGRRRQGKSVLLAALAERAGGLYHEAVEAAPAEALRRLGQSYAEHVGLPAAPAFAGFGEALDALLALGGDRPSLVVLDELPYLVAAEPSLPSLIASALGPGAQRRRPHRARVLLCGSAFSVMGGLLRADAPLRGRASLELVVRPFGYREAAEFWGLAHDPAAALRVHAIVGGTPAYRREFVADDAPGGLDDLDDWVVRTVLNPARPLVREGRVLLAEEPELRDRALYHSTLAAIAQGARTRGRIASAVGRPSDALSHPLGVLEEAGLIERRPDSFRRGRPVYSVAEPFLRFWYAVVRPRVARLRSPADAAGVWTAGRQAFGSQVLGPAFEDVCRSWLRDHALADEVGAEILDVGSGVLSDPRQRAQLEIDVVGWSLRPDGGRRIAVLGEAKSGEQLLTVAHLQRLRHARTVAVAAGHDAATARLVLFGAAGATPELVEAAAGEALLVDLEHLYGTR